MLVNRFGEPDFPISLEERKTGELWIDGKPVYIKTIKKNTNMQNVNITHSLSGLGIYNVDTLWIDESNSFVLYGNMDNHYIGSQPIPFYLAPNDWKTVYVNVQMGNLNLRAGLPNSVAVYIDWYITLKYTKTTD